MYILVKFIIDIILKVKPVFEIYTANLIDIKHSFVVPFLTCIIIIFKNYLLKIEIDILSFNYKVFKPYKIIQSIFKYIKYRNTKYLVFCYFKDLKRILQVALNNIIRFSEKSNWNIIR